MNARPLIIDCDPGQDDAVALLLAFASPAELDVLAVTTVAGNVPLELTAANARRVCELAGRAGVAVYAGCPRPILRPLGGAAHVHGADGLEGAGLPAPTMSLARDHAVDFLIGRLMASRGEVTVATLGPLTNLALAIVKEPRILHGIREIVAMGGALGAGNVTPAAEFNIHTDPHAAAVVFEAGGPLTMIGLDVTNRVIATPERVAAIRAIGGAPTAAIAGMLDLHLKRARESQDGAGAALHDPCVVAYLLRPELFGMQTMHIEIDTSDSETVGRTFVPRAQAGEVADNVNVAVTVDADGFFALLTERLAKL